MRGQATRKKLVGERATSSKRFKHRALLDMLVYGMSHCAVEKS